MSETGSESVWTRSVSYVGTSFRSGLTRVRGALVPNTQTAVFATIAWIICHNLLGYANPIMAPIATFLCLGFSRNRQPRKVIEIGLGASTGVLIGSLVAHYWGFGPLQLLLLLLTTPLIGRLLDRSDFVSFQTAINSIVVASMVAIGATSGSNGGPLDRWLNSLVGAGVALIATVILPNNVVTRPKRYFAFVIAECSRALRRLSKGLLDGDAVELGQMTGQLTAMRELLNDGRRALDSATETAAISPVGFGSRDVLAELDRMLELTERLHVTLSMLQRQARGAVTEVGPIPELASPVWQAADLMERVSRGVRDWQRPTQARDDAVRLASSLGPTQIVADSGWRAAALVSLLRAVVVDMLELTGLSMAQARATLADTGAFNPEEEPSAATAAEAPSGVWGTELLPAVPPPKPADDDEQAQG